MKFLLFEPVWSISFLSSTQHWLVTGNELVTKPFARETNALQISSTNVGLHLNVTVCLEYCSKSSASFVPLCGGWGVIWKNNLPVLALFTEVLVAYKPPQCTGKYYPVRGPRAPCDTNHVLKHSRCAGLCNPSKRALGLCKLLQQWQDWNLLPVKVSLQHHKVWLTQN